MNRKTLTALNGSIKHWERLAACTTVGAIGYEGMSGEECALCMIFALIDCIECPVSEAGGKGCHNTPLTAAYHYYSAAKWGGSKFHWARWRKLATAELKYLQALA